MKRLWSLTWAARFVAKWEGFLPHAYLDTIAQPPVYTIGYGHTGIDVYAGESISKVAAVALLTHDLRRASKAVTESIHVKLTVRQRIALISLAFNCGAGAVSGSTLQALLNAGHYHAAADQFLQWDHAGAEVIAGLKRRREAERWMFLHSDKSSRHNPHKPKENR